MFCSAAKAIARRIADAIDEMLLGDYELIEAETGLYADVDYPRLARQQAVPGAAFVRRGCNARRRSASGGPHRRLRLAR